MVKANADYDRWTLFAPNAKMKFAGPSLVAFHEAAIKVAGVKLKKDGSLHVPKNALTAIDALAARWGVSLMGASWQRSPAKSVEWAEIEAQLRQGGEVRPFALADFLMPFQKEAITFAWSLSGVNLWHGAGSGKTLTSMLSALSVPGPVVFITRAGARPQIAREIERFLFVKVYILRPPSTLRKKHQTLEQYMESCKESGQRPFVVGGWESLPNRVDEIIQVVRPSVFVADEIHQAKSTKRYDVIQFSENKTKEEAEAEMPPGGFVKETDIGLRGFIPVLNVASAGAKLGRAVSKRISATATAVKNRVRDLWSQLDLVEPNCFGNATSFQDRYCDRRPGAYGGSFDTSGSSNLDELNERLKGMTHILDYRLTHAQLPAKRRQSVYISPEDQCRESGGFAKELKDAAKRGRMAELEVRLAMAASKKRKAVLDMIADHIGSKHKICVFTGRQRDCDGLAADVKKLVASQSGSIQVWAAHGGIASIDQRQAIVDAYMNADGPCVLVATYQSLGTSISLHDTDAAFVLMLPYDPANLRQLEGRWCRLGQKRPVIIYYVIAEGTADEHIAEIILGKLPAVQKIAKDEELAEVGPVLAGKNENETAEEFASSILGMLDDDGEEDAEED